MKLWLRVALSIALIVVLLTYVVDVRELTDVLRRFDTRWLLAAFALVTLDRILMTFKWTLLLRAQGYRLPLWRGVTIYCSSMVWGLALPTTVGADAIRALMVTKRGLNGTDVVTSIVIERMVGFALALALGLVSLIVLRTIGVLDERFNVALYLGAALLIGAIGLLVLSMNERIVAVALAHLPRAVRESKAMTYLTRFAVAYRSLGRAHTTIAQFSVLTVAEQLLSVVVPWTVAMGLGVPAELLVLLGVMPLSTLLSRLPISFDGLGVFEAILVGLLMLAGIPAESGLAIAISGRIIHLLAFLPWWVADVVSSGAVRPPTTAPSKELPIN